MFSYLSPLLSRAATGFFVRAVFFVLVASLSLSACGGKKELQTPSLSDDHVAALFAQSSKALRRKNYKRAAQGFTTIARDYPYSAYAPRAQLLLAYANYKSKQKLEALVELESYIEFYPSSESLPYALYLKGLIHYERVRNIERDQQDVLDSQSTFDRLVRQFPDTPHAKDAEVKLEFIENHLAARELNSARFYQRHGNDLAAIASLMRVVEEYSQTLYTPEALLRLVESTLSLGLVEESEFWGEVLELNYHDSRWTEKAMRVLASSSADRRISTLLSKPEGASPAALPSPSPSPSSPPIP